MMKINKFRRYYKFGLATAIMSFICVAAFGQQSNRQFARAQEENAAKLRDYTWKSRMEVKKDGETKSVQLNQMRYGIDGALQKTTLSSTQPEIPTSGVRGIIARKKKGEFVKTLEQLELLAKSYGNLPPEKMQQFIANAVITPEKTAQQNLIRIQAKDLLQPGDSMIIWIDSLTRKQRKIEVQTIFEGDPMRIVSDFQDLPNGPTYMARSLIDYPAKKLAITTENFEFTRKQ